MTGNIFVVVMVISQVHHKTVFYMFYYILKRILFLFFVLQSYTSVPFLFTISLD